ncbi:MAG: zinc ribbon domain-containing protein [Treponema sp.]|nr:zinc ribbon domain-containing protein [Treponema sp.]
MAKSPRFFCENCGAEVDRNTKTCPRCGRYFASVRCPACGFTGAENLFAAGCPVCGYSTPGSAAAETDGFGGQSRPAGWKPVPRKEKPLRVSAGALPLWVYILTVFFLLCVALLLVLLLRG